MKAIATPAAMIPTAIQVLFLPLSSLVSFVSAGAAPVRAGVLKTSRPASFAFRKLWFDIALDLISLFENRRLKLIFDPGASDSFSAATATCVTVTGATSLAAA